MDSRVVAFALLIHLQLVTCNFCGPLSTMEKPTCNTTQRNGYQLRSYADHQWYIEEVFIATPYQTAVTTGYQHLTYYNVASRLQGSLPYYVRIGSDYTGNYTVGRYISNPPDVESVQGLPDVKVQFYPGSYMAVCNPFWGSLTNQDAYLQHRDQLLTYLDQDNVTYNMDTLTYASYTDRRLAEVQVQIPASSWNP